MSSGWRPTRSGRCWRIGLHSTRTGHRTFALPGNSASHQELDPDKQSPRAATSIGNNIAEGFERGTTQELLTFLYIARGSAGEVRSMLHLLERLPHFKHLRSEISDLKPLAESISRQIRAWADSLQNSDINGQRYLSESVRQQHEHKSRAAAFWQQLDRIRAGAKPSRVPD